MRRQVDWLARQTLTEQHLAGFSLAIARDGKPIYTQAYGYRNIAQQLPATPQTIYNIGSITKQFTATSIMLLQEDGKLNIDDPLSRYFANYPWADHVTVRELLNHTSGIPDYLNILDNKSLTLPKIVRALEKTRLKFAPGSKYEYSNSNYILLGVIVQRVSGVPYDDFLRRRIFQPLHLTATSIGTTPLDMTNGARGYTVVNGHTKAVDPRADSVAILDFPDGGVNTNVLDLAKWDTALDTGRVVKLKTLKTMFTPWTEGKHTSETLGGATNRSTGYGIGLRIRYLSGHREVMHDGEWTGFAGSNATFPDDGFVIVILSNTDGFDEDPLTNKIFTLFYR